MQKKTFFVNLIRSSSTKSELDKKHVERRETAFVSHVVLKQERQNINRIFKSASKTCKFEERTKATVTRTIVAKELVLEMIQMRVVACK